MFTHNPILTWEPKIKKEDLQMDPAILAWSMHKHLKPCVDRDPNQ